MTVDLSVIICAHNPNADFLAATLQSLQAQQPLANGRVWELILIDNASDDPLTGRVDLAWHADARTVREDRLGLTHARLRSFIESRGRILLFVDDDNVLCPSYFRTVLAAFDRDDRLGAVGGKALPLYEVEPPEWFAQSGIDLACRDLGEDDIFTEWRGTPIEDRRYPACAPIGAGMGIRKDAYAAYVAAASTDDMRSALGRKGADLASGEDNDMILTLLEGGYTVAYLPDLSLDHLISSRRVSPAYLRKYAFSTNKTWVEVLDLHGISPWTPVAPWSVPLRKARAWVRMRAWASELNHIRWRGACGIFAGRAAIAGNRAR